MTPRSTLLPQLALTPSVATPVASAEDARNALERLLALGVQVVDGNVQALVDIPATLATAIGALDSVHATLAALPADGGRSLRGVLLDHAERRRRLDLQELDKLTVAVTAAGSPALVGRSVVIAALVLLSNLASDERWLGVLHTTHRAA